MSSRWAGLEARLGILLKSSTEKYFLQRVNDSIEPIAALANGNIDLLIFLILRHDHSRLLNYGVVHSLHSAALCSLLSRRLGWTESQRQSIIGAALTMNIAMLELQGHLAVRGTRPTDAERKVIDEHPIVSGHLLREAGLNDEDWLGAVEQHHEHPGGTGYPMRHAEPTEMSRLLRFVDSFTAKHSPRTGRRPQPAQQAARDLFVQSGGDPLAALVIKEFGIYPPGVYVKLASGEMAIVTQRGATANAPIVAAITNKHGDPLSHPVRRDTASATNAIVNTVAENLVRVRVSVDSLYDRSANR
jgi:HD-GYP domain-containing protein (c-di-GMP phosphodiesterase class II)